MYNISGLDGFNIMRRESCPYCDSRKVRTGKTFLPHLARLALGSRRRYCANCRSRWIGSDNFFSPWARLALMLLIFTPLAVGAVYLKKEGWFEPQPGMYQDMEEEKARHEAAGSGGMPGGIETLMGEAMSGPYAQQFAGLRSAERGRLPLRWRPGQLADLTAYGLGPQGAGQPGQSRDMQLALSRLTDAVRRTGKTPQELAKEIDQTDKQTLWDKYGANFASKEEAKGAYNEFQANRDKIPR